MKEKNLFIIKIVLKLLLITIGLSGVILTFSGNQFMGNLDALLYFTIQSNITIIIITIVFLINDILEYKNKTSFINNTLLIIKYSFTVAITITFLVFFVVLAPTMKIDYLLSYNNLSVHFLVPILALLDFFFFDYKIQLSKKKVLFALIMPFYYLVFSMICSFSGVTFNGQIVPYFFLNYKKLGWFSFKNGIGVVYWIFILLIAIIALSYLINFLIEKKKKIEVNNNECK